MSDQNKIVNPLALVNTLASIFCLFGCEMITDIGQQKNERTGQGQIYHPSVKTALPFLIARIAPIKRQAANVLKNA